MRWDLIRSANWLHRERAWGYLRFMAILMFGLWFLQLGTSRGGVDRNGFLLGTDFLSFRSAGKLLVSGASPYDVSAHVAMQRSVFASDTGHLGYFYPPVFELWSYPLGLLGYFPALFVWTMAGLTAYVAAARLWLGALPLSCVLIAVAAFPAVLLSITHGQTSLFVAALLGGGLWLVSAGRKVLGGILLGLAVIKPQFGVLVPLVLLAGREWRAIFAASAAALLSAALATLCFGSDEWAKWLGVSGAVQSVMDSGTVGFAKMQSVFSGMRLLGADAETAYAVQGGVAVVVATGLLFAVRRSGFTAEAAAATLVAALLVTPFLLDYDLVLLGFPIALLATRPSLPWERIVCALSLVAPAFARPIGIHVGIPVAVPLTMLLFALLVRRMIHGVCASRVLETV